MSTDPDNLNDTVVFKLSKEDYLAKNAFKLNQQGVVTVIASTPNTATVAPPVQVVTDPAGVVSKPVPTTDENESGVWKFWWIPFLVIMILLILGIAVFIIVSRIRRRQRKRSQMRR